MRRHSKAQVIDEGGGVGGLIPDQGGMVYADRSFPVDWQPARIQFGSLALGRAEQWRPVWQQERSSLTARLSLLDRLA